MKVGVAILVILLLALGGGAGAAYMGVIEVPEPIASALGIEVDESAQLTADRTLICRIDKIVSVDAGSDESNSKPLKKTTSPKREYVTIYPSRNAIIVWDASLRIVSTYALDASDLSQTKYKGLEGAPAEDEVAKPLLVIHRESGEYSRAPYEHPTIRLPKKNWRSDHMTYLVPPAEDEETPDDANAKTSDMSAHQGMGSCAAFRHDSRFDYPALSL